LEGVEKFISKKIQSVGAKGFIDWRPETKFKTPKKKKKQTPPQKKNIDYENV